MKEISLNTFLFQFCQNERPDKKYCFILGSGASKPSGIPTGGELVKTWMFELAEMYETDELDSWKSAENIDMDDLAKDYSKIFDKRFELDEKEGFAFLEKIMEGKEPSCGYSVLAQMLEVKPHNIVITTNFDSLTEDALFIYTKKKPLVVGHEALAHFIKPFGTRPIIVKIHRDLYLSPKNTEDNTSKLETSFKPNLTNVFKYYTPLVIGYGGNDGSLMGFLEELDEIEGGLFWFYRKKDGGLTPRIQSLLEEFNGFAVAIPSFDDLMIQIGNKLKFERLDKKIEQIAKQRAVNYRDQIEKITVKNSTPVETKDAVDNMVARGGKDWWYYEVEASKEKNITKCEEIYQKGIQQFNDSSELHGSYANFLKDIKKDFKKAEIYYKKAIEIDPGNVINVGNYAMFLFNDKKNYDLAEKQYTSAIELEPKNITYICSFANLLSFIRKDFEQAEIFYEKALRLAPENTDVIDAYAVFLSNNTNDDLMIESLFQKIINLVPDNAVYNGNYAKFLITRKEIQKAKHFIKKAFELNDNRQQELDLELWFYCYAVFFHDYKEAKKSIEALLEKGIVSPGWYLDDVLAIAKELRHPDYDMLCEFERKITAI